MAQMVAAMTAIESKSSSKKPTLTKPRLGGISVTGVWTGSGASGLFREPNSTFCMRTFDTDVIKNHQAMAPIEDRCKKGLRDSPELLFCMPDESNAGTIVSSIRALEDHIILCGMEGAFNIITSGAAFGISTLTMLQHPGRVNSDIVSAWCRAIWSLVSQDLIPMATLNSIPFAPTTAPTCCGLLTLFSTPALRSSARISNLSFLLRKELGPLF
jgi:hypothetical protein